MNKIICLIPIIFLMNCDMSEPKENDLLDYSRPFNLVSMKNTTVNVFDKVNQSLLGPYGDFQQYHDYFQMYLKTKVYRPPSNTELDEQLQYRVILESKNNIFINNIDSLSVNANLEVLSVSFWNKNLALAEPNRHSSFMNLANPKISYDVYVSQYDPSKDNNVKSFHIVSNNVIDEKRLSEVSESNLPFKIKVVLHLISGENILVNIAPPGQPAKFATPMNHVRYRLYFTLNAFY